MERELITPGLPLTEGGHGECVLSGDEGGQPHHARLVTHDHTTRKNVTKIHEKKRPTLPGAVLADAAPGRLGQVCRGQDEEGDGGVRG